MRGMKVAAVALLAAAGSLPREAHGELFTVTSTRDDSTAGSLRHALMLANSSPGPDTVLFAIPMDDPGYVSEIGVWRIEQDPANPWPGYLLQDGGTVIDGSSQARFIGVDTNPVGPEIEIVGTLPDEATHTVGFIVDCGGVELRSLCIHGFFYGAVYVTGQEEENPTKIVGCYINVDPTGTVYYPGAGAGVTCRNTSNVRIGGPDVADRNVITGDSGGILVWETARLVVVNNHVGTDRTGTVPLGGDASHGLSISGVSDTLLVQGNVISSALLIANVASDSSWVLVEENRIGLGATGQPLLPAYYAAVHLSDAPRVSFRRNAVAFSQRFGVHVDGYESDFVTLSRNSIFGCGWLGINLCNPHNEGPFYVDRIDGVYGPGVNEEIDPCLCDSVVNTAEGGGGTTEAFFTAMPGCVVEVFVCETGTHFACPDAVHGDVFSGMTYLGDAEEIEIGAVWSRYRFVVTPALPAGALLTTTATNANGSTSEFGCSCAVPASGETAEGCRSEAFHLFAPAPNPCRFETAIRYHLPERCGVRIEAFDMAGRRVAVIVGARQSPGVYGFVWKPQDDRGNPLPSGTYVIRLTTETFTTARELVILE